MKIKFNSEVNLSLNKTLKVYNVTIIVRTVFEEDGKYYPHFSLDKCLYELWKCCSTIELIFQKELTLIKQVSQKNVCFVLTGILKTLIINFIHMFVMAIILRQ